MKLDQFASTTTVTDLTIKRTDDFPSEDCTIRLGDLIDGLLKMKDNVRGGADADIKVIAAHGGVRIVHESRVVNKSGSLLDQAHDRNED